MRSNDPYGGGRAFVRGLLFLSNQLPRKSMKSKAIGLTGRELKAEELDTLVKADLAKKRAADAFKMSRLRALRLAGKAEEVEPSDPVEVRQGIPIGRKSMPRRKY